MENLSKERQDELCTSLAILALYDGEAEVSSDQINTLLEATNNEVEAYYPVIFSNFLNTPEKIAEMIASPGGGGGGAGAGGGGGGDAGGAGEEEEEKEEEKEEEEEMDLGGGMDMFGGEEGDGDY